MERHEAQSHLRQIGLGLERRASCKNLLNREFVPTVLQTKT